MSSPNAWPELGISIRRARQRLELTQTSVAKAVGIMPETLNRIERGAAPCRADVLARVAKRLGVSLDELVPDIADEPEAA